MSRPRAQLLECKTNELLPRERHNGRCFFNTSSWARLEAEQRWSDAQRRVSHASRFTYAQGAAEGLSRAALQLVLRSGCLRRIEAAPCEWEGRSPPCEAPYAVHRAEDAALGLCMRLHLVRLIECGCFHPSPDAACNQLQPNASKSSQCGNNICRFPIVVHYLKDPASWPGWWEWLNERSNQNADGLLSWQRRCSLSF